MNDDLDSSVYALVAETSGGSSIKADVYRNVGTFHSSFSNFLEKTYEKLDFSPISPVLSGQANLQQVCLVGFRFVF